ncbi:MAG: TraR/DksA C4-type zinc finger protein [Betaproteobacteria bacterium]
MTALKGAPPAPMTELRARLAQRQRDLETDINRKLGEVRSEKVGFDSNTSTDGGDAAQLDALGSVHHAEVERDLAEVRDIGAALARMDAGTYGTCIGCGEPIEPARMLAWPTAKRCTTCQRERERSQARTSSL